MARRQKKYHYIYKTTCSVTNRYYIGMHSTDDLDDGYLGSGKRLWASFNYHGKEKHTKEIIEFCDTREELSEREKEIVNEQLLTEDDCMNLIVGGDGGYPYYKDVERAKNFSKAGNAEFIRKLREDSDFRESISKQTTEHNIRLHKEGVLTKPNYDWNGKNHTEESKLKMSESKKGKYCGEENSVYGRKWMYKEGVKSKMVKKEEIDIHLNNGWLFGKKNKK